jgi:hypothetical protein
MSLSPSPSALKNHAVQGQLNSAIYCPRTTSSTMPGAPSSDEAG